MIIIPEEKPVIENLNTYYLDIKKLLEHYQGKIGTGAVFLKSSSAESIIFFDENSLINTILSGEKKTITGKEALKRIIDMSSNTNFSTAVYKIDMEKVYFWASLQYAEEYYKNLSADFTDPEKLFHKMELEKFTGYIDISIDKGKERGLVFINNGVFLGICCSWEKNRLKSSKENLNQLLAKAKKQGSLFNVNKINFQKEQSVETQSTKDRIVILNMIQDLLNIFEKLVSSNKKIKSDFNTLLKKKFMEKIDRYDFLDPFAAEFQYDNGAVDFTGKAPNDLLLESITESIKELGIELGIIDQLRHNLDNWREKFSNEIDKYNIIL